MTSCENVEKMLSTKWRAWEHTCWSRIVAAIASGIGSACARTVLEKAASGDRPKGRSAGRATCAGSSTAALSNRCT